MGMGIIEQDLNDGNSTQVLGADGTTIIGNVGDRLKVDIGTTGEITASVSEDASFCVEAAGIAIGNNKSMISLVNAGGSSVIVKIKKIYLVNDRNTAITGTVSNFSLLRITDHSAGTSLTPTSYDTSDTLSASVTARTGATVSGEVATILRSAKWSSDEWGAGAQDVEAYDHTYQELKEWYSHIPGAKPLTLRAGEGVHIKHTVNSTAGSFKFRIEFIQV